MAFISYFPITADNDIAFDIPIMFNDAIFSAASGTYQQFTGSGGDGTNTIKNLCDQLKSDIPSFQKFKMPTPADFQINIPSDYSLLAYFLDAYAEICKADPVPHYISGTVDHVNGTSANLGTLYKSYSTYDAVFSQPAGADAQTAMRMTALRFSYGLDYYNRTGTYARKQMQIQIPLMPENAVRDGIFYLNYSQPRFVQLYFYLYNSMTWVLDVMVVDGSTTNFLDFKAWINGQQVVVPPVPSDDPYTGAGYPASTAPGGMSGGSFDFTEDGITGVHTPGLDLLNTGLITAWRPSKATLAQLAGWLWITTPGQVIQQLFGNPINAIIGLNIVPVSPPVDGGTNTIKFGNEDSHVACPKITSQHVTVDCGTLTIDPKYGSYMDFAPQTSAELFLPYVGGLPLDVNDVIGKTIGVKYQVDVLSGACVAYVFINGVLHYQKAGSCAATAPITGSQMPNIVAGVLSIAGSVAGFVASAGASGASTAAKVASGIATGTSVAESAANMLKQSISYSGTISGWAGLLGAQKPYLILSMPHAAIPGGQNTLMGYPAWVSGRVGDFTGYTECTVDRVTATRATDKEVEEIKSLLEGGVIL